MTGAIGSRSKRVLPFLLALCCAVSVILAAACGQGVHTPDPDAARAAPAGGTEPDLPVLTLQYRGETIQGSRSAACWQKEGEDGRTCSGPDPWSGIGTYVEVSPNEQIQVLVVSDILPDGLFALMVTEPGDVHVDSKRMSTVRGVFEMKHGPGDYKVRVTGNWEARNASVSYEFGLRVAGKPELTSECASTLEGGDLDLVLQTLDDRMRTAIDALNSGGCRFNVPIAQIRMVLSRGRTTVYIEAFRIDPPSPSVPFPLKEGIYAERTGGPLGQGEYSRRIVAVATDGQQMELTSSGGFFLDRLTLAGGEP